MGELAGGHAELFHGLPAYRLRLPQGDSALVLLYGAQVISWVSGGRERLYLSPRSKLDGLSAVRGGIPICFPQFNQRGPLPKHGFARTQSWQLEGPPALTGQSAALTLSLPSDARIQALWPQPFKVSLLLELQPGSLRMTLQVNNPGPMPMQFTGALHTYLAVSDVSEVRLMGLDGQPEWDALTDMHGRAAGVPQFRGEFDRVYEAGQAPLVLHDAGERMVIAQSPSWANTVVWNPGAEKCASLPDMPPDGYASMLCVEAAQVMQPIDVPRDGVWSGWQCLRVQ